MLYDWNAIQEAVRKYNAGYEAFKTLVQNRNASNMANPYWMFMSLHEHPSIEPALEASLPQYKRRLDILSVETYMAFGDLSREAKTGNAPAVLALAEKALEHFEAYTKALQLLVNQLVPGPASLTYEGFRVENPERLPHATVMALLKGIDRALALFKARGVEDVLYAGIQRVFVRAASEKTHGMTFRDGTKGIAHGRYFSRKREIEMVTLSLNPKAIGSFMREDWAVEVFVHEFGHYVHMDYITPEAREFFNSGWEFVNEAKRVAEVLTAEERRGFVQALDRANWNFKAVGSKLKGLPRAKYLYWLYRSHATTTPTQLRLTEWGRAVEDYKKTGETPWEYGKPETFIHRFEVSFALGPTRSNIDIKLEQPFLAKEELVSGPREKALEALGIPSDYGKTNVREDFAETFTAYMANPASLSKTAKWRLLRALGMSGSGGKPVMRLSKVKRLARRVARLAARRNLNAKG